MSEVATIMELKGARAMLRLSQQKLADEAGVAVATVSNCERGASIYSTTAHALLEVLNAHRAEKKLPPLTINDIDWKIRG